MSAALARLPGAVFAPDQPLRLNLVFLPATEPDDGTFGVIPSQLDTCPGASVRQVVFPTMVWYSQPVREQAIAQIQSWPAAPLVLIGFSKSGLGAWNIARAIPDRVAATIIFDAPVARLQLPPWGTRPFYADDAEWRQDLPILTTGAFQAAMRADHRLILISGEHFHTEMEALSEALGKGGMKHVYLPCPEMKHRWDGGWIEEGLSRLAEPWVADGPDRRTG